MQALYATVPVLRSVVLHALRSAGVVALLAYSSLFASERPADRTDTAPDYRVRVGICGIRKNLLGNADRYWNSMNALGLHVDLPVGLSSLDVRASAAAGTLHARAPAVEDLQAVDLECLLLYTAMLPRDRFGVRFGAGLASSLVFFSEGPRFSTELFNTSESEFGAAARIAPLVRVRRWSVALSFSGTVILSEPNRYTHLDAGLHVAREF